MNPLLTNADHDGIASALFARFMQMVGRVAAEYNTPPTASSNANDEYTTKKRRVGDVDTEMANSVMSSALARVDDDIAELDGADAFQVDAGMCIHLAFICDKITFISANDEHGTPSKAKRRAFSQTNGFFFVEVGPQAVQQHKLEPLVGEVEPSAIFFGQVFFFFFFLSLNQ